MRFGVKIILLQLHLFLNLRRLKKCFHPYKYLGIIKTETAVAKVKLEVDVIKSLGPAGPAAFFLGDEYPQ